MVTHSLALGADQALPHTWAAPGVEQSGEGCHLLQLKFRAQAELFSRPVQVDLLVPDLPSQAGSPLRRCLGKPSLVTLRPHRAGGLGGQAVGPSRFLWPTALSPALSSGLGQGGASARPDREGVCFPHGQACRTGLPKPTLVFGLGPEGAPEYLWGGPGAKD